MLTTLKAPVTLRDGRSYMLTQLCSRDMMAVVKAAKQRRFAAIVGAIPETCSAEDRKAIFAMAKDEMDKLNVEDESVWSDLDNLALILYFALRKEQPNITIGDVTEMLDDDDNLKVLVEALNGLSTDGKVGTEKSEKK